MEAELLLITYLSAIEQSIISWRSASLTAFFKMFPVLVSPYFYILIVALGFWTQPQKRFFRELAVLVPLSTLLNGLLKNIFQIPRPQAVPHLIVTHDPYGFPSGDMQVSTVFFAFLFLQTKSKILRVLYVLMIVGVGLSRVYLGVHRLQEVLVGFIVGLLTIALWQKIICPWIWKSSRSRYLILISGMLAAFLLISYRIPLTPMFAVSTGTLIALAYLWPDFVADKYSKPQIIPALILLFVCIAALSVIPMKAYPLLAPAVKVFLIIVAIFKAIPSILTFFRIHHHE